MYLVSCLISACSEVYSLPWISLSSCRLDSFCPCLDYYRVPGLSLFVLLPGLRSLPIDPVCSLNCSCVLPMPYLFAGVSTLPVFLTMSLSNKILQMDPHVSRLVHPVTISIVKFTTLTLKCIPRVFRDPGHLSLPSPSLIFLKVRHQLS